MAEARYLYCIAGGQEGLTLGNIGIEGNNVYSIAYKDLFAIVHNCPAEPYKSEDKEKVKLWLATHAHVVDTVWESFGTVLPLGFDTIIKGEEGISPDQSMKLWLMNDYDNLKRKLAKLDGKAEFGVQILWDPKIISENLVEMNPEIKKLGEEIKSKSKGLAYMYKQKLENLLKKELEKEAENNFNNFYAQIKACVEEIKVEKTKKSEENKQMLINLSCLLIKGTSRILGEELEKINNIKGFSVRFTGPWPPYSFV